MTVRACLHPNCELLMARHRHCCSRHWFQLPEDMRDDILEAARSGPALLESLQDDAIEYFHSRLIGDHEIVTCRGKDCGADIVFLVTRKGKDLAVNADAVEPDDDQFEFGRHVAHSTTCPNADDFRRPA